MPVRASGPGAVMKEDVTQTMRVKHLTVWGPVWAVLNIEQVQLGITTHQDFTDV